MKTMFDPVKIGPMMLKNRFVRSATWEMMAEENGHLTAPLAAVYEQLAAHSVGLILTSSVYLTADGGSFPKQLGLYDESFLAEYRTLMDSVHGHGARMVMQINVNSTGGQDLSVDALTEEEIADIVKTFGDGAARAKRAGLDGVEIHAAHGFLLSRFLVPSQNHRTDAYGGSMENRMRIVLEVYDEVRRRTGDDFAVLAKVNAVDADDAEACFAACQALCSALDERGIDAIEVSGGADVTQYDESQYRDYAAQLAAAVRAPVILVGKNRSLRTMDTLLSETEIGLFSLARPFVCQPELVDAWAQLPDEPARCHSCGNCIGEEGLSCAINRK